MQDVYCAAPFRHACYLPSGDLQPCCHYQSSWSAESAAGRLADFQQQVIAGVPDRHCAGCYAADRVGVPSMRTMFNDRYSCVTDQWLDSLEFSLGNLCNLKCMICNSFCSSKWIADDIKLGKNPSRAVRKTVDDIKQHDLSRLTELKLKGGEPLLEQETICEILEYINQIQGSLSGLRVDIISNGTVSMSKDLLKILDICKLVKFKISMDGIGEINDYQRTDCNWQLVKENLLFHQSDRADNWLLDVINTWSLLNVRHATECFSWMHQHLPRYDKISNLVYHPKQLAVRNLPDHLKQIVMADLQDFTQLDHVKNIADQKKHLIGELVQPREIALPTVVDHIKSLDSLRNLKLCDVDPVLWAALTDF
jgi:sulfatase maturation enzyme AslB (radical SAM superfamily)